MHATALPKRVVQLLVQRTLPIAWVFAPAFLHAFDVSLEAVLDVPLPGKLRWVIARYDVPCPKFAPDSGLAVGIGAVGNEGIGLVPHAAPEPLHGGKIKVAAFRLGPVLPFRPKGRAFIDSFARDLVNCEDRERSKV